MKSTLKSIGTVLTGIIVIAVLSIVTDIVVVKTGFFPPSNTPLMLFSALVYRSVYAVIGGYVVATLAPDKAMRHVIILATVGTVLGILGMIANWSKTSPGNEWYPIALVPASFIGVWLGGKLKLKSASKVEKA